MANRNFNSPRPALLVILLHTLFAPLIFSGIIWLTRQQSGYPLRLPPLLVPAALLVGGMFGGVVAASIRLLSPKAFRFPLSHMIGIIMVWMLVSICYFNSPSINPILLVFILAPVFTLALVQTNGRRVMLLASWLCMILALLPVAIYQLIFEGILFFDLLATTFIGFVGGSVLAAGMKEELEVEERLMESQRVPNGRLAIGDDGEIIAIDEELLDGQENTIFDTESI